MKLLRPLVVVLILVAVGALTYLALTPQPFWWPSTDLDVARVEGIPMGASSAEVTSALGEPIVKAGPEADDTQVWSYVNSRRDRSLLVYLRNDKVVRLSLRQESPFKIIWSRP